MGTKLRHIRSFAIHYLGDLNAPHHPVNKIAYLSFHTNYESWVDQNVINYLITAAPEASYNYVKDRTFKEMADGWSSLARAQIGNADRGKWENFTYVFDSSTAGIATQDCLSRAQRAAAALYYRFITDTGRLLK
jgi:hypothetical protein